MAGFQQPGKPLLTRSFKQLWSSIFCYDKGMDCIFCKIVAGEVSKFKVYEDDLVLAFLAREPVLDGHTLIIPKKHAADIRDIDDESLARVAVATKKLANLYADKLGADGFNLRNNSGAIAHQEVFHFHLHLIPRYKGDGRELVDKPAEKPRALEDVHKEIIN